MEIKDRIIIKIQDSQQYLADIQKITKLGFETFSSDSIIKLAAERLFIIVSQVILDICTQISTQLRSRVPENYSDCIDILVEYKILLPTDKFVFQNIIKMRNLVVHQYGRIDYEILFSSLSRIASDFKRFSQLILKWLDDEN